MDVTVQRYSLPTGTGVSVDLVANKFGNLVYVDDIKPHLPDGFFEKEPAAPEAKVELSGDATSSDTSTADPDATADGTDAADAEAGADSAKEASPEEKAVVDTDDAKPAQDIDKEADAAASTENPDSSKVEEN